MAGGPITAMIMHPVVKEELLREAHLQRLERSCRLIDGTPFRNFDALGEQSGRVQVLITSWGCPPIDRAVVAGMPGLKLIAHLAGSVKGFIDDSVWRMGIQITNAVAANAVPVAEYTLAAILFSNKQVLRLAEFYRKHHENRAPWAKEAPNVGNYQKTVGIIGASHVGRKVIELLRPFDIKVLLYDPYITPLQGRELGAHKAGLSELLSNSDVVSMHAPLLNETRHMLGAREFALMQDGATFINTARGAVIDQQALESRIDQRPPERRARYDRARSVAADVAAVSLAERAADAAHRRITRHRNAAADRLHDRRGRTLRARPDAEAPRALRRTGTRLA